MAMHLGQRQSVGIIKAADYQPNHTEPQITLSKGQSSTKRPFHVPLEGICVKESKRGVPDGALNNNDRILVAPTSKQYPYNADLILGITGISRVGVTTAPPFRQSR